MNKTNRQEVKSLFETANGFSTGEQEYFLEGIRTKLFITKILLITNYIASGNYLINCSYRNKSEHQNRTMEVLVNVDDSYIIHNNVLSLINNTHIQTVTDFAVVYLIEGYHLLSMFFRQVSGGAVSIDTARLSIHRVS